MKYDAGKITNSLLAAFGLAAIVGFADHFDVDDALINALPDSVEERVEAVLDTEGVPVGTAVMAGALVTLGLSLPKRKP